MDCRIAALPRARAVLAGLALLVLPAVALPSSAHASASTAVLTGVVTDSTGAPVVGACPLWQGSRCGSGELTDAKGAFRRELLVDDSVDSLDVTIVPAAGDLLHESADLRLTRAAGWKADLKVAALAALHGLALAEATGAPVAGVCPQAWPSRTERRGVAHCSGSDGVWTIGLLPPGTYAVALRSDVLADSFVPSGVTFADAATTTVAAGATVTVATTRLRPAASITAAGGRSTMQLVLTPVSDGNDFVTGETDAMVDPSHVATWIGIEPGTYEVRLEWNLPCDWNCPDDISTAGAPVWYPGSFDPSNAASVALASGQALTWPGPVPSFATVTANVKGLPRGSRVSFTAFFGSGVQVPYAGGWTQTQKTKSLIVTSIPTLPPVPLKLQFVAHRPDGTTLTWWYGGSSQATAKLVKPNTTVKVTAPKK